MRKFLIITLITFLNFNFSQNPLETSDYEDQKKWVDSVYNSLNQEEKIGQLFTVWVATKYGEEEISHISSLINKYKLGGLIFSLGKIEDQADATNHFQSISKVPLLIGMDAEWGIGMRLDDAFSFPYNMTLGAIEDESLVYKVGERIGKHANRLGVHINFAPVVDINTNPDNPIIGSRSFGEDKFNVTEKALAYLKGMQSTNLMGSAKHFPGHGDTQTDSHYTLPLISFDKERIYDVELYPYKKLIENNLSSVMTAHINVPSLQKGNLPSTLSNNIINNILKNELTFNGLIVTDALDMKGVVDFTKKEYADVSAMKVGNDILLMPNDLEESVKQIKKALARKKIPNERLEESVKKILMAKYKAGLHNFKEIQKSNIVAEMNEEEDFALLDQLAEQSMTLVINNDNNLPLKQVESKIAYIKIGDADNKSFLKFLNKYSQITDLTGTNIKELKELISGYDHLIVGFHKSDESPFEPFRLNSDEINLVETLKNHISLTLTVFAKPYCVSDINIDGIESILIAYQNRDIFQEKAAQVIFGSISSKGRLPVSIHEDIPVNTKIEIETLNKLSYSHYLNNGFSTEGIKKIDSLINHSIEEEMTPGAQLLIAKDGKVVYNKSYGYQTFKKKRQ